MVRCPRCFGKGLENQDDRPGILLGPTGEDECRLCGGSGEVASADLPRDGDMMVAWLREAADEIEKAHAFLDHVGVPRSIPGNEPTECTLAARINLLVTLPARDL